MLFFERILHPKTDPKDQRRASRYAVGPDFPIKAVLNLEGCDEYGETLTSSDGKGWDWIGRLINFSATGANVQLPPATAARRGDPCALNLALASYRLKLPCHVAHMRTRQDSILFGLRFDLPGKDVVPGYQQLLELVAFGASLKPERTPPKKSNASGYHVEHYHGDFAAHLTVWRSLTDGAVQWFEFQLAEYCIRGGAETRSLEFSNGREIKNTQPISPAQVDEIHQLFRWVVPNIARVVPADVRHSLQGFAA